MLYYCPYDAGREVRKKSGNEFLTIQESQRRAVGRDDWYFICAGRATKTSYRDRDYMYPRGFYPF
jgi:hypothetical protein